MRRLVPAAAALAAYCAHFGWFLLAPSDGGVCAQAAPMSLSAGLRNYLATDAAWSGASYAMPAAFTAYALLVFRESRRKAAAGAAGGIAVMGAIYAFGCFAFGCCGSPMLAVWLSWFGGRAIGVGGPFLFGVTLLSTAIGFLVLRRKGSCACESPDCESGRAREGR